MALLEVRDRSRHFGGRAAVDGLSFGVEQGAIRGPIGPNGAGKRTTLDVISGCYRPTAGDVVYRGETIARVGALAAILETGRVALEGPAVEPHEHAHVGKAYLGG